MNTIIQALKPIFLILLVSFAVACGGGSSVGSGPTGGIDRLGVSVGTVDGFGSIFVNGVRFNTDSAEFDIDDDASGSSQDDLAVGDVVAVTFDPDSPNIALTVIADEVVEGPVDSVNAVGGTLVVVGQTVLVDANTSFDNSNGLVSLDSLAQDDFVEVSGFIDGDGTIRATRIERKLIPGEIEVHGAVTGLTSSTFNINALTIDYTSVPAIIDDSFPGGAFSNGDFVEVKGTSFSGNTLLATKVEPDGIGVGAGGIDKVGNIDVGEIEGFITRFVSATDFDVAGFAVTTNANTVFEGGTASDLGLNVKVEVEGSVNNAGVLVANKVDIRRSNDLRVTALVDSVNSTNNTLTLLGIDVRVDTQTRLEDKSDADLEPFNFSQINVGDYVEVVGGQDTGGADILALRLEREDLPDVPGEDTEIRSFVDSVNRPILTIAGVSVDTSSAVFRDLNDNLISADAFFAAVAAGDLVDADGTQTGVTSISAEEVELEN